MSIFSKIGQWLGKAFNTIRIDADKVAISVTEAIKQGLDDGILPLLADIIPGNIPKEVIALLEIWVPKLLAVELAIQGLPEKPTGQQIQDFTNVVIAAVASKSDLNKSQLWSTFAGQIYNLIESAINANPNHGLTFAQIIKIVDDAYNDYKLDQTIISTTTSTTTK